MATEYHLEVYTQEKKVYEGEVVSLIAPGEEGYVGVLANHAPLLSTLSEGTLTVRETPTDSREFRISGGFLEVHNNRATILADRVLSS